MRIRYNKNPHQKEFQDDITSKFLHLSGGYGSGKSHGLVMKLFDLSIRNRNLAGGLVCPTYTDFKRDMLELIDAICLQSRINFKYHKTEHWFSWPWSVGKTFVATAEKALKGPNWAYAVINELTLIPFDRYRETIARVRLKKAPVPQVASCGTPEGLLSGYYKFFIEEPAANSRIIYGSTRDNLHNIGTDYLASLRSAYDERQLEAYLDGKFVSILGNRFYYSYNPEVNDDPSLVENPDYPVMISMDFNVDPMVATVWQWQMDGSIAAVHEIILRENADTNKMARALIDQGYTPDRTELYPDPAGNARSTKGQPDIQILRNHGFYNIKMRPHAPPFRKRQLNVCNLLDKRKIKINPKHCPWMKRDLLLVTQDQSTLEKEKSSRELTHSSDGMDYMIDILFQYSGSKPDSKVFSLR